MGSHDGTFRTLCTYHEGNDPVGFEFVDEVRIEFDPLGVGGVVATT